MRGERRGSVVQSSKVANLEAGMSNRTSAKPYVIAKRAVWEAYQQVKANRGAAGIDEETIAMFEQNLSKNLYKLWNRMSSGSYFPPPVKQVEIPKARGGTRKLGIPTVSDRIAQTVVKQIKRAEAGSDVPCGFVWISARQVGQTGDSRHPKTVLAIRLGG
jgi:retron-type reverse transcriptase